MKPHICVESKTCSCSIIALEPNEDCPIHGSGPWPPRCEICGRLMKWSARAVEYPKEEIKDQAVKGQSENSEAKDE